MFIVICISASLIDFLTLSYTTTLAAIVRDFQSQVLQEEWNKFGSGIVERRSDRVQKMQAAAEQHHAQNQQRAQHSQQRMARTEASIEQSNAKFADLDVSVQHDARRLLQKHGIELAGEDGTDGATIDRSELVSKPLPCLGQRAHWMDCQKKYYSTDIRPCNDYVKALEECVSATIQQQNHS